MVNVQTYAGTRSPYNFNGLVRHYYLRRGPNLADIQVNLLPKGERALQSHEIAKQVRQRLLPIAGRYGARIKVAEVPPGPPVLETLVAEVYGPEQSTADRAGGANQRSSSRPKASWTSTGTWKTINRSTRLLVDEEKAALNGISEDDIGVGRCRWPARAEAAGLLHDDAEKEDVPIVMRLPRADRDLERDPVDPARGTRPVALGRVTRAVANAARTRASITRT